MSRNRAFNFPVRTETEEEGGPFELEINDGTVKCHGEIDGLELLTFTAVMRSSHFGTGDKAHGIIKFLQACVVPEDWPTFESIVQRNKIDIESLGDICNYLQEVYSTYPTKPVASSSDGSTTGGPSSEETSSDEG